jgi:hypothetical protein
LYGYFLVKKLRKSVFSGAFIVKEVVREETRGQEMP